MKEHVEKMLEELERMNWITINKNIVVGAVAVYILDKIIEAPYKIFMRYIREILP